jgi:hypothetical protein
MVGLSGYWWATGVQRAEPARRFLTRTAPRITEHHGEVKHDPARGVCAGKGRLRINCFRWPRSFAALGVLRIENLLAVRSPQRGHGSDGALVAP